MRPRLLVTALLLGTALAAGCSSTGRSTRPAWTILDWARCFEFHDPDFADHLRDFDRETRLGVP